MNTPAEKTVALSAGTLSKIKAELEQSSPDLKKIHQWLTVEAANPDLGFKLVIPSTYRFSHALGFIAPAWLLIDPPDGQLRVLDVR